MQLFTPLHNIILKLLFYIMYMLSMVQRSIRGTLQDTTIGDHELDEEAKYANNNIMNDILIRGKK